ncbi:uncharacterized protein [Chironomus tepperi]|uniref:uncharacterized protein n=1 Tax=Chironomus tepperi TaxID=113505 RepID=UPI00391F4F3C
MREILLTIFVIGVVSANKMNTDEHCVNWAKNTVSIHHCCKLAPLFSHELKTQVIEDIPKSVAVNSSLYFCHLSSLYFDKLNVSSFDQPSMRGFLDKVIQDPDWLPIMKNASDSCVDNGIKNAEKDQTSLNVPKEECDARFLYYIDCFVVYCKVFCPAKFLISSESCLEAARFFKLCGDSKPALKTYMELHQ